MTEWFLVLTLCANTIVMNPSSCRPVTLPKPFGTEIACKAAGKDAMEKQRFGYFVCVAIGE